MDVDAAVQALLAEPFEVETARRMLPDKNAVYAWWTDGQPIPGAPPQPHPHDTGLDLFYVGIALRDAKSCATLKSRIVNNHLRGNTGSSTFRFTLAALLMNNGGS